MPPEDATPETTPAQQPQDQPKPTEQPATTPPAGSGEDVSGLKSALDKERDARKAAEKQAKELAAWKQQQEDKDKSESERLTTEAQRAAKERDDALAKIAAADERVIRSEVRSRAVALGFADPEDAWALIDKAGVTLDEAGEVQGAEKAVKALADKKPHLLKRDATPYGAPAGNRSTSAPPDATQVVRGNLSKLMTGRRAG